MDRELGKGPLPFIEALLVGLRAPAGSAGCGEMKTCVKSPMSREAGAEAVTKIRQELLVVTTDRQLNKWLEGKKVKPNGSGNS